MEFFDVTIVTDDNNEDSVAVEPRQGIAVVNKCFKFARYVKVDETPIEDYVQDVLKPNAGKEAHDKGEPSENDGQQVHNSYCSCPLLSRRTHRPKLSACVRVKASVLR